MADQIARGDDFERQAEKKIHGWAIFGSKYESAAELYEKAANSFKIAKSWDKAGSVYIKLAGCHLKLDSKHEAASAYVDAANCYKKTSSKGKCTVYYDCSLCVMPSISAGANSLIQLLWVQDIGELYEQEQNLEQSIVFFERSADLFQSEEVNTSANQCRQKVAQFSAQLEQYEESLDVLGTGGWEENKGNIEEKKKQRRRPWLRQGSRHGDEMRRGNIFFHSLFEDGLTNDEKAIEIYEDVARQSLNNNLLKYSVKGYLLNAGLCQLCKGDVVAITNALDKYQDLAASIEEEDVTKFTDIVKEFDSMTRLDPWKTTLLLRVKEKLKAKELEEDDLT
ncbi:hypothetical protein Scep_015625 [Stephania cephalantha]|uniref:Alpha-soluble NSF attachment protein n=1 Tax=Stephania cephalantha TaxID=152367 RepID=A0AAP0J3I1_9MAGN